MPALPLLYPSHMYILFSSGCSCQQTKCCAAGVGIVCQICGTNVTMCRFWGGARMCVWVHYIDASISCCGLLREIERESANSKSFLACSVMNGFVGSCMRIQWEKTTLYQETSSVNTLTQSARASFLHTKAALLFWLMLLAPLHYEPARWDLCKQPAMQMMASRRRMCTCIVQHAREPWEKLFFNPLTSPDRVYFLHLMTAPSSAFMKWVELLLPIVGNSCLRFAGVVLSDEAP